MLNSTMSHLLCADPSPPNPGITQNSLKSESISSGYYLWLLVLVVAEWDQLQVKKCNK